MARNKKGQFEKGNTPHNKGARMEDYIPAVSIAKIRRTQFKKGILPHTASPKGTVSGLAHRRKGIVVGYDWFINIDWHGNRATHYNYRKYLWEVENQQDAPKGMVFVALDGDCAKMPTINNVEMISRSELIRRNNPKIR